MLLIGPRNLLFLLAPFVGALLAAPASSGSTPRPRRGCCGQGRPLSASWTSSQFLCVAPMSYSYVYGIAVPEVQP